MTRIAAMSEQYLTASIIGCAICCSSWRESVPLHGQIHWMPHSLGSPQAFLNITGASVPQLRAGHLFLGREACPQSGVLLGLICYSDSMLRSL